MVFCARCGRKLNDGTKFCPGCGAPVQAQGGQTLRTDGARSVSASSNSQSQQSQSWEKLSQGKDLSGEFRADDIEQNKLLAVLSYFSLLVILPIFLAKESKYARFHANQGMILMIVTMGWQFASSMLSLAFSRFWWQLRFVLPFTGIVYILLLVLFVMGVANALSGKAKELPLIGKFRILN